MSGQVVHAACLSVVKVEPAVAVPVTTGGAVLTGAARRGRTAPAASRRPEPNDENIGVGFRGLGEGDLRAKRIVGRARLLLDAIDADQKLLVVGDVDRGAGGGDGQADEDRLDAIRRNRD